MFLTLFSGFTNKAIPSYAIVVPSTWDFSSSFNSLEDIPISEIPEITSFIPAPEPFCCISKVTLLFSSSYFSWIFSINGPTEVEPDIEIVTESLLEAVLLSSPSEPFDPQPTNVAPTIVTNNAPTINFNFLLLIFIPPLS